jgi:phosphatidylserine decarboxylase
MTLTRYGIREWGLILLLGGGGTVALAATGWTWLAVLLGLVTLAGLAFFRVPMGVVPPERDPGELLAPAHGRVSAVERVEHHPAAAGPATIVRIYLSVFDVHVNRSPCTADVLEIEHQPGKHLDVRDPSSVQENEWLLMSLRRVDDGLPLGVRQIAGLVARRIVCAATRGGRLDRGRPYGMIKFGSSTELIVPDLPGLDVRVRVGERVAGGRTILAVLPPQTAADATETDATRRIEPAPMPTPGPAPEPTPAP